MTRYHCTTLLVLVFLTFGCVTKVAAPEKRKADYNSKIMMQKWRNQMSIQNHYPTYTADQDNPTEATSAPNPYAIYAPEDDNPDSSFYYLVPAPKVNKPMPPKDGFNEPLFKRPARAK